MTGIRHAPVDLWRRGEIRFRAVVVFLAAFGAHCNTVPVEQASKDPHPSSIATGIDCSNCHTTSSWKVTSRASGESDFDHSKTGFPLSGEHSKVGCSDCHSDGKAVARECATCHTDPHRGRLGMACDTCHSARSFQVVDAIELHRRTAFPLDGMHVLANCSECHRRPIEKGFVEAPRDCYACHRADYQRLDVHPVHQGTASSPPLPRDCGVCHRTMGWLPATFDPSSFGVRATSAALLNHDSRFPISFGAHRGAECASCHISLESAPQAVACTGCHEHAPLRLMQQHRRPVSPDGRSCVGCHPGGMAP